MSEILVRGKLPAYIKKEEIRAIVYSVITVMAYHSRALLRPNEPVVVTISRSDRTLGNNRLTGGKNAGWASRGLMRCLVDGRISDKADFITVLIHEAIHLCANFAKSDEYIVSTMTDKIKPVVVVMATALAKNTYRRAAFLAHCRPGMAYYKSEEKDHYNDEQWANKVTTEGTATE